MSRDTILLMKWAIITTLVGLTTATVVASIYYESSNTSPVSEATSPLTFVDDNECQLGGKTLEITNSTNEVWYVRRGQGALIGIISVNDSEKLIRLPRIPEVPPGPGRTFIEIQPGSEVDTNIPLPSLDTAGERIEEGWYLARIEVRVGNENSGVDIEIDTNPFFFSDCDK